MQESNIEAFSTFTRSLVNQANALTIAFGKCFGNTVFNAECNMMNALVAFVEPFLNGALRRCGLKQLKFYLATFQECGLYFLVGHFFNGVALKSKNVFEIRQSLFDTGNGNSQVFDV